MTSDIGKHPKRRKKENINVTSGEMIDLGTFLYTFLWNTFSTGQIGKNRAFLVKTLWEAKITRCGKLGYENFVSPTKFSLRGGGVD